MFTVIPYQAPQNQDCLWKMEQKCTLCVFYFPHKGIWFIQHQEKTSSAFLCQEDRQTLFRILIIHNPQITSGLLGMVPAICLSILSSKMPVLLFFVTCNIPISDYDYPDTTSDIIHIVRLESVSFINSIYGRGSSVWKSPGPSSWKLLKTVLNSNSAVRTWGHHRIY